MISFSTVALRVLWLFSIVAVTLCPGSANALQKCKAKVDKRTGVIQISAAELAGPLQWGVTAGNEVNSFFNEASCVEGTSASRCEIDDVAELAAKTPPAGCTVYLSDGVSPSCSVWLPSCTPGLRPTDEEGLLDETGLAADAVTSDKISDGSVTTDDLADASVTDDKVSDVAFSKLFGVPAGLADGDDDTTYSAGPGLDLSGTQFSIPVGGIADSMIADLDWGKLTSVPAGLDDGDDDTTYSAGPGLDLSGTQFGIPVGGIADSMIADLDWGKLTGVPAGLDDGDDDTTYSAGPGLDLSGTQFGIATGGVSSGMIQDGSVGTTDLGDGSVSGSKLASGAVTNSKVSDVAWGKLTGVPTGLADGDDDTTYAAGTGLDLSGALFSVAPGGITGSMIQDGTVTAVDLANSSVTSAKISDGTITSSDTNTASVQARVTGFCSAGDAIIAVAPNGTVTCETNLASLAGNTFAGNQIVNGSVSATTKMDIGSISTNADRYLQISTSGGNAYRAGIQLRHFANDNGFTLVSDERGVGPLGFHIIDETGASSATRLFIKNDSGEVGIGTTSPASELDVSGEIRATGTGGASGTIRHSGYPGGNLHIDSYSTTSTYIDWFAGTGLRVGNGASNYGPVFASAFSVSSDERLKEDIVPIDSPLDRLGMLNGVSFLFKRDPRERHVGLIAQDVELAFPEVVGTDDFGYKVVDYPALVGPLVAGLNELRREKDEEVLALLAEKAALEERLAALEESVRDATALLADLAARSATSACDGANDLP